jgi:hypothetical protein
VDGTNFPRIPDEIQERIIGENWKAALPQLA